MKISSPAIPFTVEDIPMRPEHGMHGLARHVANPGRRYAQRMEADAARRPRRYESRPGCLAVVTATLDELHGPITGIVELPNRLLWRPDRTVDLDDAWSREWMYALVLRESRNRDDLRTWLDGEILRQLWPTLNVPRGVRQAWEEHHPALRRHRLTAA